MHVRMVFIVVVS